MDLWAVVCAGGSGTRIGGLAKQFRELGGMSVLRRSVLALHDAGASVIVVANDFSAVAKAGMQVGRDGVVDMVEGGKDRRSSVSRGLFAVGSSASLVAVHDAARPLVTSVMIDLLLEEMTGPGSEDVDGVIPVIEMSDTVKEIDEDGVVLRTLDRTSLARVQTPQIFRPASLRRAHAEFHGIASDDAGMLEGIGCRVKTVAGDPENLKITYEIDFAFAEVILQGRALRNKRVSG